MPKYRSDDPEHIESTEKAAKALEIRKLGATWEQVAKLAGYANKGAAHNAVNGVLRRMVREPAEELVALEAERLDTYLLALSTKIKNGDIGAITTAIKIGERRAKLLGLDDFERRMAEAAERKVALQERDAVAVAQMLANVVRKLELDEDKTALARDLVMTELKALGAARDVVQGELA